MSSESKQLDPDAPISTKSEDKFVFSPFANGLAREIAAYNRSNSFTIGICGPWGSGKTSLINLTTEALSRELLSGPHNTHAIILPYSPWLVGNRDALLRGLLPAVASSIRKNVPRDKQSRDLKQAIRSLEQYGRAIRGVEAGLTVGVATATAFGFAVSPWLAPVVAVFGSVGRLLGLVGSKPATLDELRDSAQDALSKAKVRVLIVVDDLDRLDPHEIVEMARLIRSTLNLPHVTFLVAYDRQQVATSIKNVLGVDGDEYLEKIVQLKVDVPIASPYDLTRALAEELQPVFGEVNADRAESVKIALWRAARPLFLNTPRDVARIANAVSFGWSMLKGAVDAGDILFITCLRIKAPDLYAWSKQYCEEYFNNGAHRAFIDRVSERFRNTLIQCCEREQIDPDALLDVLGEFLPGLSNLTMTDDSPSLFGGRSQEEVDVAIRGQRLSSPEHWRKYYDLVEGRYGITDQSFADFLNDTLINPKAAVETLLSFTQVTDPAGTTLSERLLDRVQALARGNDLNNEQRMALASLLAETVDRMDSQLGPAPFFGASPFQMATWTLRALVLPLTADERCATLAGMAQNGSAIGWMSYVLRAELFAQGRIGERNRSREAILSEDQLDAVISLLLERIRSIANNGALLELHSLMTVLWFWSDASGNPDEVRQSVEQVISTDEALVQFLFAIKQMVRSTAGDYWRIDQKSLRKLCDIEGVMERLNRLSQTASEPLSQEAGEAKRMLVNDND